MRSGRKQRYRMENHQFTKKITETKKGQGKPQDSQKTQDGISESLPINN